ncbi:MAG: hypothetical protein VB034_02415 [Eubacteriales bacterium]|nr:hypothetical protein [Eubacteriales bacterium]
MKNGGWRFLALLLLALLITVGYGRLAFHTAAMADEAPAPTVTPGQVETVVIEAVPTPEPEKVPRPQPVIYDYGIGQSHLETVARAMYGLDTAQEKLGFAFLVVNRLYCGQTRADGKRLFAQDITDVVAQAGEFGFYDPGAPVTDENLELAELGLNIQLTSVLTKQYTGYVFPPSLIYMGWENGEVVFYAEKGGEAWRYGE